MGQMQRQGATVQAAARGDLSTVCAFESAPGGTEVTGDNFNDETLVSSTNAFFMPLLNGNGTGSPKTREHIRFNSIETTQTAAPTPLVAVLEAERVTWSLGSPCRALTP